MYSVQCTLCSSNTEVLKVLKGHQGFFIVCSKAVLFMIKKVFLNYFLTGLFLFGADFRNFFSDLIIYKFSLYTKNEDDLSSSNYLLSLYIYISTLVEPKKIKMGLVITNDKASYVAKGDSICLFSVAKETALNEQWNKTLCPPSSLICAIYCEPCPSVLAGRINPQCRIINPVY